MKPSHRYRSTMILLALLITASTSTHAQKPAQHKAEKTQQTQPKEPKKCNRPPVKKVDNALTRSMRNAGKWIERRWHGEPQPAPTQQPDRRKQVTTT